MKTRINSGAAATLRAALFCLFLVIPGSEACAQLDGADNFNDNSRDAARWGDDDLTFGNGRFSETNQRLHYLTSGGIGPESDWATRQWQTNYGRFTDDWEVQLDINLPDLTLDDKAEVEIGLGVGNAADLGDNGAITLNTYRDGSVTRQFWSNFRVNTVSMTDAVATTAATSAAVRIRWTAAIRTLSFEYDANGAVDGYSWTELVTRRLGIGGYDWGMTDASWFGVAVYGGSDLRDVTLASSVYADNFLARTVVASPAPRLSIALAGPGQVRVSWSPTPPGWVLQENLNLGTTNWVNSPSGTNNPANVPATLPTRFYRLHKL